MFTTTTADAWVRSEQVIHLAKSAVESAVSQRFKAVS